MNRKYIFAAFAVAAAAVTLITAGCKSIEDEPAGNIAELVYRRHGRV